MGLLNISSILPEDVINNISKEILKIDINNLEPKLADPGLIQIDGYVHTMQDENTHLIEKDKPFLTEEDSKFQPFTISYVDLKAREYELQDLILEKVTGFLRELYGPNFNRIIKLEILDVSEDGIGFEEMWRAMSNNLYLSSGKVWNPRETHLYVNWKVSYKLLSSKKTESSGDREKLPTIGEEKSNNKPQSESKETRSENGEVVMCLPENCLDNLTAEVAKDYLATKALDGIILTPYLEEEEKEVYINGNGVVIWSKNPPFKFDVKTSLDFQTEEAKNSLERQVKATQTKLKDQEEQMHQEYLKVLTSTKGEFAARFEDLKYQFKDFKSECTKLSDISGAFAQQMAKLPAASVVTTPTGPGVAINIVMTVLDILKGFANLMKDCINKIENLIGKLRFDLYAPLIPGLNGVYLAIKNLLSLAKTAVSLVGG